MSADNRDAPSTYPWRYRRLVVFATILFSMAHLTYLLVYGQDTRLNDTMAFGHFGLLASTIGFYVAGATWHDTTLMKQPRSRRRIDPRETEAGDEDGE